MKKEINVNIGFRLKKYRNEKGLTQEQMAERMEMSLNYYGQIERGECGISLEKILLLYKSFDIEPTYLLTGEKKPDLSFDGILNECPKKKRYDMERLIKYALNLAIGDEDKYDY